MSAHPTLKTTPEDYLAADRAAEYKSEYYQGEVFAMAGASRERNQVVANLITELNNQVRDCNCTVFASDLRLNNASAGSYTYLDVTMVCGPAEFTSDAYLDTLLNPSLLVEVLSPSTAQNDRGNKFLFCRSLPSLLYYLLVEPRSPQVEIYSRTSPDSWSFREFQGLDAEVPLPSLQLTLPLREIYRKLNFNTSGS